MPAAGIQWLQCVVGASIVLASLAVRPQHACGQTPPALDGRASTLKQLFEGVAAKYEITSGTGSDAVRFPLRQQPIMHWLSLEGATGTYVGSVFVWTHQRRPEVVGTFFASDVTQVQLSICQELYSFAAEPLTIASSRERSWRPMPIKTMSRIPGAPVPAATENGRRRQIRTLAKKFSGRMNRRGVPHSLRLLPRPVYQYESDAPDILSGALFVLVAYTTDPDILLLIESRQTAEGPQWFFQPARFSDKSLWLSYQDRDIWTSLRQGHGTTAADEPEPQYHVDFVTVAAPFNQTGDVPDDAPRQ